MIDIIKTDAKQPTAKCKRAKRQIKEQKGLKLPKLSLFYDIT